MDEVPLKSLLFAQFAMIGKALGNGHRLEIIDWLAQGPCSVEEVAGAVGLSVANASQHLQHLRRAGLVSATRRGQHMYYRISDDAVLELMTSMQRLAESNIAEVEKLVREHLGAGIGVESVPLQELVERMRQGEAMVLDVRHPEEFMAGHIPGAVNIPLEEIETLLDEIPADREIIAYCRGPYCALASNAVALLKKHNMQVRRLRDGFPQWKLAGMPVEEGQEPGGAGLLEMEDRQESPS